MYQIKSVYIVISFKDSSSTLDFEGGKSVDNSWTLQAFAVVEASGKMDICVLARKLVDVLNLRGRSFSITEAFTSHAHALFGPSQLNHALQGILGLFQVNRSLLSTRK